jgi:hypothetical protein
MHPGFADPLLKYSIYASRALDPKTRQSAKAQQDEGFLPKKVPLQAIMLPLRWTAPGGWLDLHHSRADCTIADGVD